jgi:hypothetical protein
MLTMPNGGPMAVLSRKGLILGPQVICASQTQINYTTAPVTIEIADAT